MKTSGCLKCGNTNEWSGYIYGFCDACAKSILEASAKRLRRKANTAAPASAPVNKKLTEDIARAQASLAALATAPDRQTLRSIDETPSPEGIASLRQACESETKRLQLALVDHRLLWAIFRRSDKSTPYYAAQPVAEPVSVAAEPEPVSVAAEPEPVSVAA
jgi:hypothetical protein